MKKYTFYLGVLFLVLVACGEGNNDDFEQAPADTDYTDDTTPGDTTPGDTTSSTWLIPISEVKDGGPGKDGIPSIDTPKFVSASDAVLSFLKETDLVVGVFDNGSVRAYPHPILDWHEAVNDKLNGEPVLVSYCPLTGTAFGWKGIAGGNNSTFGVSGLLYNANLILYDRNTDSNWSQLGLTCVNGSLIGDVPELIDVVETNWGTWKTLYPNSEVLSSDTGFSRSYGNYPYGSYKTDHDFFIFSVSPRNSALPNKERVYAIINDGKSKVYQFDKFQNGKSIIESFNGTTYLIVGNENLINSFVLESNTVDLNFEYDFNNSETFFKDIEGNKWSVFGKAIEGPRKGQVLKAATSVVSYWFAIAAFYPNPVIY